MTAATPLAIIFIGSFVTLLVSRAVKARSLAGSLISSVVIALAIASLAGILRDINAGVAVMYPAQVGEYFSHLRMDDLGMLVSVTALLLGLMVSIFSFRYMEHDLSQDKYYALLLIMIGSIVGLCGAGDLFTMWVFFELMCVSSYILVSFRKDRWEPLEAGFKYIVMSAAGSMLVLLGISLVFGYAGSLNLAAIRSSLQTAPALPLMISTVLFICGFGVKAAVVPFHTWLPDAHSEAPSGISAMLSGIVIEAGLFAMIRALITLAGVRVDIGTILIILGLLSMTIGNIMALAQTGLKRMLAYSSVAQMGYIVLGLGIGFHFLSPDGFEGGLFHIVTHAGMKGLAFLAAGAVIHYSGATQISDMRGLAKKMPAVALAFALAAFGLAGVPPFSGFMSKWLIYKAGIAAGGIGFFLAGAAILNSVFSLGYYLPVVNTFFDSAESPKIAQSKKVPLAVLVPIVLLAVSVVVLGIYPDLGLLFVSPAVKEIFILLGAVK